MAQLNQHPNFGFNDPTTPKNGSFHSLDIYYVPSDRMVSFKAFITGFSDEYTSNWDAEEIYGRMDPVQTFKSTTRSISVSFDVVAASKEEAKFNLAKISELATMHYPVYSEHSAKSGSATALNQSPLLRVKYMNWICKANNPGGHVKDSGLLVASSGFSFAPQMDDLMFGSNGNLYPKLIKVSLTLNVVHEHDLGWDANGKRTEKFPYNEKANPAIFTKAQDEKIMAQVSQEIQLDEAVANGTATQEQITAMEDKLGLNGPTIGTPSD